MQSSPIINGMPRRVFSLTVLAARDKSSGLVCRMDPTCLFTMRSSRSPPRASSCIIWPTFSSSVIRESKSAIRSPAGKSGFLYGKVSAVAAGVVLSVIRSRFPQ